MMKCIKRKPTICATVSPYIAKKVNRLVKNQTFSSNSDLVSMALSEFLIKFPDQEEASA